MKVILQKEVEGVGDAGDVVQVADGYARNYLIPRGLATAVTKGAIRHAERMKGAQEQRLRKQRVEAEALAFRLANAPVRIPVRAGEEGRLFGQVTPHQVADALAEQVGEKVDHRRIHMDEPVRSLGAHSARVRLHPDVDATLTLDVVPK